MFIMVRMMELNIKANIQQVIEMFDHDTNEKIFFIEKNDEWVQINEQEYNQILEANNE